MKPCPKCGAPHRGPRAVELLHGEACNVLVRAHAMGVGVAAEYLRSQWLGGALELSGWCSSCVFAELAATAPGARPAELDRAAQLVLETPTPEQIEEAFEERKPLHVCTVIGMDRYRARAGRDDAARDLLAIGSPKAGETP